VWKNSWLLIVLFSGAVFLRAAETENIINEAVDAAWWHRSEIVTALELTPEMSDRMDGVLRSNLEKRITLRTDFRDASKAFRKALVGGDWKAADQAAERLAEVSASRERLVSRLKIDVLSLLSTEQLTRLAVDYPKVIRGAWVRRATGRRGAGGGTKHVRKR